MNPRWWLHASNVVRNVGDWFDHVGERIETASLWLFKQYTEARRGL